MTYYLKLLKGSKYRTHKRHQLRIGRLTLEGKFILNTYVNVGGSSILNHSDWYWMFHQPHTLIIDQGEAIITEPLMKLIMEGHVKTKSSIVCARSMEGKTL